MFGNVIDKETEYAGLGGTVGKLSYYGKYERGVHPLPIERLIFLCKFYNVSADYILGLPENMPFPKRSKF